MEGAALLDLVCGPASPLTDTEHRYRLVSHLGSGGQAEVYRAVRVCCGVSSAPVTVKVFRLTGDRPLRDQLHSWDKGDAVLMDLNSRGVTGICRRSDGFYGPMPHPPGQPSSNGAAVPYQVLDYLHGVTLREYVTQRRERRVPAAASPLDAVAALTALAGVLRALHQPDDPRATPVLHMDVKPSNVMVLGSGEVRLIDFTGARYHWRDHITSVAYTPEVGGPEAFTGNVGPAYDVHGFGAVAYYLVTGDFPRATAAATPADGIANPPWAVLRRHPLLDANPVLRDHLLAPVADRVEDRPGAADLVEWTRRLAELVRRASGPDVGVVWDGHAEPVAAGVAATGATAVAGAETGAFHRIERLEQELFDLRSAMHNGGSASHAGGALGAVNHSASGPMGDPGAGRAGQPPGWTRSASTYGQGPEPTRVAPPHGRPAQGSGMRGVAAVPSPRPEPTAEMPPNLEWGPVDGPPQPRDQLPPPPLGVVLKRGSEVTGVGLMFAFVCWGIWSVASGEAGDFNGFLDRFLIFVFVLMIGFGVFLLSRLVGRLIWVKWLGRVRRNARGSHALTAVYLVAAGLGFLNQTPWVVQVWSWLKGLM
ncbi:MAG: serine/threonine protein kinase [Micromonosporaceae bacterium]